MTKRKLVFGAKYKKGTVINNKNEVMQLIGKKDVVLEILERGEYDDGKSFIKIKIDNI